MAFAGLAERFLEVSTMMKIAIAPWVLLLAVLAFMLYENSPKRRLELDKQMADQVTEEEGRWIADHLPRR